MIGDRFVVLLCISCAALAAAIPANASELRKVTVQTTVTDYQRAHTPFLVEDQIKREAHFTMQSHFCSVAGEFIRGGGVIDLHYITSDGTAFHEDRIEECK